MKKNKLKIAKNYILFKGLVSKKTRVKQLGFDQNMMEIKAKDI